MKLIPSLLIKILVILFLLTALPFILIVLTKPQILQKKASVPGGKATFILTSPDSVLVNGQVPVVLKLGISETPANKGVTGIGAKFYYTFSGDNPLSVTEDDIKSELPSDWNVLFHKAETVGNKTTITFQAIYAKGGENGYLNFTSNPVPIATINFTAQKADTVTLIFDEAKSEVLSKDQNLDVLTSGLGRSVFAIIDTATTAQNPPAQTQSDTPAGQTTSQSPLIATISQSTTKSDIAHTIQNQPTIPVSPSPLVTQAPLAVSPTVQPTQSVAELVRIVNLIPGQTVSSSRPTFTGKAAPGAKITVLIQSDPIQGETIADGEGNWVFTPSQDIPPGNHSLTVTAVDNAGRSTTAQSQFTVVGQTAEVPPKTLPVTANFMPTLIVLATGFMLFIFAVLAVK